MKNNAPWDFAISSRQDAQAVAARVSATHVIGLLDPSQSHPDIDLPDGSRLRLSVLDVEHGNHPASPSEQTVRDILVWGERLRSGDSVLFHCEAGQSRSPAAAIALLAQALGPGHEHEIADMVWCVRPEASPNRRMVAFVDAILGYGGQLSMAIAQRDPWQVSPSGLIIMRT